MDISAQIMASVSTFTTHSLQPYLLQQESELSNLSDSVESTRAEFAEHASSGAEEVDKLRALQAQQKAEAATEEARVAELEKSLSEVQLRATTLLPAERTRLTKSVELASAQQSKLASEVSALSSMHAREIDAVSRGVNLFRNVLGVEFAVRDAKLHILFAFIRRAAAGEDPAAHTHSLSLFVDENKEYQVASCTPELDAMPALLASLNSSNNFARFISEVRREFVKGEQQQQQLKQ